MIKTTVIHIIDNDDKNNERRNKKENIWETEKRRLIPNDFRVSSEAKSGKDTEEKKHTKSSEILLCVYTVYTE